MSPRLRADKEVILQLIGDGLGRAVEFASDALRDDADVARAAIRSDFRCFGLLSPRLRDTKELVRAQLLLFS